jgi:hypothetical protein
MSVPPRRPLLRPLVGLALGVLVSAAGKAEGGRPCAIKEAGGVGSRLLDYGPRGNRCEGLFTRQVATPVHMQIIGFLRGRAPRAELRPDGALQVRVLRRTADTTLRAIGTRPRLNYGMDTAALAADGRFTWDARIVASPQVALSPTELALVACSNGCADSARTVYMPVEFEAPPSDRSGRYAVILRSLRNLHSLEYEVLRDGRSFLRRSIDGPLVAERPIPLALGALPGGSYTIRIIGTSPDALRGSLNATLLVPDAP